MKTTGEFETSEEIINAVYHNAYWGIRSNYRSMPTDCPQRDERMGWTGDRTTGNYGESYIFDNHRLYDKWLVDGEDGQWGNGSLSDVWPPYWRRYTDNMTWPGAFITVADMLYTRFGDDQPIRQHYPAMKRWMLLMKGKYSEDGIITRDTYGDWCMPPESPELVHSKDTTRITKAPLISTPFYCFLAGKMLQFAQLLGLSDDVDYFRKEIAVTTKSFNEKYLNKDHISASWVNGQLRAARGKQLYYEHTGYNRNYTSEIFLTFKNGKMTDMKTFNNNVRTEGFDLTNGKVMQALQDGLDTKEYSELKGSRVLARISDMDINKSGELKDCKVRIIMRKNGYSTELTNHPLEKRVKNALKNLSPWRTLYINGNVIIPHSTFTFPITVE